MPKNPTYYDGDLAGDLVAAAVRAIEAGGPASVSLRSLARELGVSNAAPKNHFVDKAALFAGVAIEGFSGLIAALERSVRPGSDTALVDAGVAYVAYALEHPAHFAVMWQPDLFAGNAGVVARRAAAYDELVRVITAARTDLADPSHRADRANRAWAVAHGWAALLLSGSLTVPSGTPPLDYVREQLTMSTADAVRGGPT
ncbi:MAG: TetR/AcrR family transcriptional regulator [Actinomycetota bacterium]